MKIELMQMSGRDGYTAYNQQLIASSADDAGWHRPALCKTHL